MSEPIDHRVSMSLHPACVRHLEGFDEETRPFAAPTETAFSEAYVGIGRVHDARIAAERNPTWNAEQRLIQIQDFADKIQNGITRRFDSVHGALNRSIASLEQELSTPITAKAAVTVATEIRGFAKGLESSDRLSFLQNAIDELDEQTVSSVLGAPAYLSGLEAKTQSVFIRLWHERANPVAAKRLNIMSKARDLIRERGSLVFSEIENAVGATPQKVAEIKKAKAASERAFVLPTA